jgi:cytochrome c-type biogenesis protein CcmH/NrfG
MLSTGGLFIFLPYVLLILFVTYIGARAIFQSRNSDKLKIASIFATWIGMLAINFVTVDNLGISVWFWITGGVLVAVSEKTKSVEIHTESRKSKKNSTQKFSQIDQGFPKTVVISFVLTIAVLVLLTPNLSRSSSLYILKNNGIPASSDNRPAALTSEAEISANNPQQLIQLANLALSRSAVDQALPIIERINQLDSRSYYGNYFAAIAHESQGNLTKAITYRETLLKLDPWGTDNMLQLIKSYLATGKLSQAKDIGTKVKKYYPGSQADIDASAILAG